MVNAETGFRKIAILVGFSVFFGIWTRPAAGDGVKSQPKAAPTASEVRPSIERALTFLQKDAILWRDEHKCATCHHGAMTVWALSEARERGFTVPDEFLADMIKWSKDKFVPKADPVRDARPGFNNPSAGMAFLTFSTVANKDVLSKEDVDRMTKDIVFRQEADGGWEEMHPLSAPPIFESREIYALWFDMALDRLSSLGVKEAATARSSRDKAAAWLTKHKAGDSTQAAVFRLCHAVRSGDTAKQVKPAVEALLARQNQDGGWSQVKPLGSDAYATGQALYALGRAGVGKENRQVQRGIAFLLATQKSDGSWPMLSRETSVRKVSDSMKSTIYFGSAWATLGLLQAMGK